MIFSFEDISLILVAREACFSSIKRQDYLMDAMSLSQQECRILEMKCVRHSLKLARSHTALQPALNRAVYLSRLVDGGASSGLALDDAFSHDFAGVLWDQGNIEESIQMLKQVNDSADADKQAIVLNKSILLADLVSD